MSPRGKQLNGLLTQQKMLRAAVALFLESGYEKTTTAKIAKAAGMTQSSFFRAFASKEALLLELVRRMFGGQFALAEQHSGIEDPVLLYAVETSLQLHIAELTEPLRELYVVGYSLPTTSAYIYQSMAGRLQSIFGKYMPDLELKDFYEMEIASASIMRGFMAMPCDVYFTMEAKISRFLECSLKLYDVPRIHSRLLGCHLAIAHQNDFITLLHTARCRTVQANHATACFACDGVGFKAFSVVDIYNLHLFIFQNTCGGKQIGINGDAADIIQFCLHNGCSVDFSF